MRRRHSPVFSPLCGSLLRTVCALSAFWACVPGQPMVAPHPGVGSSNAMPQATASTAPAIPAATASNDVASASRDEVVQTALSVFGDTTAVAVPDSLATDEPEFDLDVRSYEAHERVAHYVNLFSTTARERFVARLSRGTQYEPMIRAKLRASGMPEDLTYLALIESGYDPHAYSRAAAVGMWQFMSSTARGVGMRVDWWVDERRDPARSTDGAIRFLGELHKQFGSLYLAAAAYNGGPGRVSRGLSRFAEEMEGAAGDDRFFALAEQDYLRAETKNYVPQLIAAALVAKMPDKYGLAIESMPAYAYDSVLVDPGTSLAAVSLVSGVAGTELRDLNPALLRGIAPPDASVWVRVPLGAADRARAGLDSLAPDDRRGYRLATVKGSSTSPTTYAKAQGVTLQQLRWFNPSLRTTKKGRLVAGQQVRIPRELVLTYARSVPDPSIEKYGASTRASSRTASMSARATGSARVHVVRRGETLGGIARRYGLTEARLKSLNGLRGTRILAGQKLKVQSGVPAKQASKSSPVKPKKATSKSRKVASSKSNR